MLKKMLVLAVVLFVASIVLADTAITNAQITLAQESSKATTYWGMSARHLVDRSGLNDPTYYVPPTNLHGTTDGGQMLMAEKQDWNGWNAPYCVYQRNDHPFWPGDYDPSTGDGTINSNYVGVPVQTNSLRDNPARAGLTMYNCSMDWVRFGFDQPYYITTMDVWNFNGGNDQSRGWQSVDIHYTVDGTNWLLLNTPGTELLFHKEPTPGAPAGITDVITFNKTVLGIVMTEYSNFDNTGSYVEGTGVVNTGGGYSGMSEIQFNTPEPATMALLGLGALVLRRKK
jgi:hypothetical protein